MHGTRGAIAVWLGMACSPGDDSGPDGAHVVSLDPAEVSFVLEPNDGNTLSALAYLTSDQAVTLHVGYGVADGELDRKTPEVTLEPGVETEVLLLGMPAGKWDAAVVVGDVEGPRERVSTDVLAGYPGTHVTSYVADTRWTADEAICASLELPAYVCTDRWGTPTLSIGLPGNMMFVRALSDHVCARVDT